MYTYLLCTLIFVRQTARHDVYGSTTHIYARQIRVELMLVEKMKTLLLFVCSSVKRSSSMYTFSTYNNPLQKRVFSIKRFSCLEQYKKLCFAF